MRVYLVLALVLCGGLLSGCDTPSSGTSGRSSAAETGCPRQMELEGAVSLSWSPRDHKLAVSTESVDGPGGPTIWLLHTTTCEVSRTKGVGPEWSPEGMKLVFSLFGRAGGLFTADPDGGNLRRITVARMGEAYGANDFSARWSPRGNLISFLHSVTLPPSGDIQKLSLWVVRPDGGGRRLVRLLYIANINHYEGGEPPEAVSPEWSTDGRWMLVTSPQLSRPLSWINVRGKIRPGPKVVPPPRTSLSPRGGLLALTIHNEKASPREDDTRIMLVLARGGRRHLLVRPPAGASDYSPSWSPDGRWIAFARKTPGVGIEIYAVRPNGRGLHRLTKAK